MTFTDDKAIEHQERLQKTRQLLKEKIKKIDDLIGLLNEIRTVTIKQPESKRVAVFDENTKKQKLDEENQPMWNIEETPAVTEIPINKHTLLPFTPAERHEIFDLVESKMDEVCN